MKITDLDTPALILDQAVLQHNREAMRKILQGSSLSLRPHYKSHKCAALARIQMADGAVGMTCAKLSEAEDLADSGIADILIANQIVQPQKIRRLADLANRCRLTVCVDNAENIAALGRAASAAGSTIHCLVEVEIGMMRCGVTEPEDALALAGQIIAQPSLRFAGIQAYAGHISHMVKEEDRRAMTAENEAKLRHLLGYLAQNGAPVRTVSGGSTGTAAIKAEGGLYTELQAGSYLFMDATYAELNLPFRQSLFLLSTVVSAREGLMVADSGVKTCGVDQGPPHPKDFSARKIVASEEHFQFHFPEGTFRPGDPLLLIPGHCCSTVNLHDKIYVVDGETVIDRLAITGRGIGR